MWGYGDVPLCRGTFFLKGAEVSVSFFRICVELWVPFEAACRIIGTVLGKYGKYCQEEQRI